MVSDQLPFKIGDVVSNNDLFEAFRCPNMGGMRRSLTTNSLLLICDHTKNFYADGFDPKTGLFLYTGMGKYGDQSLDYFQNKTLAQSNQTHVKLYLFEVFETNHYFFEGAVVFKEPCRFEFQKDANGLMRKVIVFPLEYLSKEPIPFTEDIVQKSPFLQHRIKKNYQEYENQIGGLQKNQAIAKSDRKDPFLTTKIIILPDKEDNAGSLVNKAEEDTRMVLDALRQRSAGKCELCKQPAPFVTSDGIPYLEVHHIVPVSQGGKDTIDNEVLLCPNCHRKVHLVYSPSDIEILKKIGINSN